ncbi:MAG TPA: kynureninase [Gemmatimonadota bacterium]|nr:kynureninase [Gemmatimonadota bacterium]
MDPYEHGEEFARSLDADDPLRAFRDRFELPGETDDRVYLLGNSLGPLPRAARAEVAAELDAWAERGVESYFEPPRSWIDADSRHRRTMADMVGARPEEVALTGSLTTNLHLLLASFFRPRGDRFRVLIERPAFPSDRFVVETQLAWHGIDPSEAIIEVGDAYGPIDEDEIEQILAERGDGVALVFMGGVNYLTGQALDVARITRAAHVAGCPAGFDMAHAAGNVPLALHDGGADFAAWCTYKYLNAGPGAVAGLFVHERHAGPETFRLGGWWGLDPDARFRMDDDAPFRPRPDAAGWQLSCPPVLAMAPLGPTLAMFGEAGMPALRAKSERLTAYLEWLLAGSGALEQITPTDPARRGAQLSYRVNDADGLRARLSARGVDVDARPPDVLRLAPAPLFNSFRDVWRAARLVLDEA